jgi:hypothetical protein
MRVLAPATLLPAVQQSTAVWANHGPCCGITACKCGPMALSRPAEEGPMHLRTRARAYTRDTCSPCHGYFVCSVGRIDSAGKEQSRLHGVQVPGIHAPGATRTVLTSKLCTDAGVLPSHHYFGHMAARSMNTGPFDQVCFFSLFYVWLALRSITLCSVCVVAEFGKLHE